MKARLIVRLFSFHVKAGHTASSTYSGIHMYLIMTMRIIRLAHVSLCLILTLQIHHRAPPSSRHSEPLPTSILVPVSIITSSSLSITSGRATDFGGGGGGRGGVEFMVSCAIALEIVGLMAIASSSTSSNWSGLASASSPLADSMSWTPSSARMDRP